MNFADTEQLAARLRSAFPGTEFSFAAVFVDLIQWQNGPSVQEVFQLLSRSGEPLSLLQDGVSLGSDAHGAGIIVARQLTLPLVALAWLRDQTVERKLWRETTCGTSKSSDDLALNGDPATRAEEVAVALLLDALNARYDHVVYSHDVSELFGDLNARGSARTYLEAAAAAVAP